MESGVLRAAFDAMPAFVFVVDDDVCIIEYNAAAAGLLDKKREQVLHVRGGEALDCLHAHDSPDGCGRGPACRLCVIRNSVNDVFGGSKVSRRRAQLQLTRRGETVDVYSLITATPFEYEGRSLALLIIEDFTQLAELQRIIPICAACKKVRDDKDYWVQVDAYFNRLWELDFSHGLCPDCLKKEMDKLDRQDAAREDGEEKKGE